MGRVRGTAPVIRGRNGYPAQSREVLEMLGVTVLPLEGMPEREIQGVRVYVKPLPWGIKGTRRNWCGLRVMAICQCGRHVPVGRLQQHICKGVR